MQKAEDQSPVVRFGLFEVDLRTGEIRKSGRKVNLQEQPFQVLATLLERPGELVTREELQEKLWPAETVDFESGVNKAIRKIREALDDSAGNPRFVETLPRRGYRFIAAVQRAGIHSAPTPSAAPPAEELIVQGRPSRSLYKSTTLTVVLLTLGVIVAGLLVFNSAGWRNRLLVRSEGPRIESIAVLPLENLSGDPAQDYFAEGMTDGLITEVARIGSLRVISRTSIMQYKSARKPLPVIAKELGVDAVVEGTVLHSGQKVRITAQLIRTRDDRHLWSEKYERDLSDVLALQGEVAQAIAGQIRITLTPQEHTRLARARPVNGRAYDVYVEGSYFRNKITEDSLNKSIELFTKAIELDASYAPGYSGLAQSYCRLGIIGARPPGEVYTKARVAATKALQLDETVAEAHSALADVKKGYDWDWAGAEAEYKRALELNPSDSVAHYWYADYLSKMRRQDEAIMEATRARELDPISVGARAFVGFILYRARRYDDALVACWKAVELDPYFPWSHWIAALVYEQKHKFPEAVVELEKAMKLTGGDTFNRGLLGQAYTLAGERPKALAILGELKALSEQRYVSPLDIAIVYTGLGDRDSAFQWLEKAYQERAMRIQELPQPHFDGLRPDPRFQDLMRRIRLPL
jgi:TolB-like protein/DNA-binding winged helix-turn-helix (wHTH) protein/Flp pilus assembly protein TadD